MASSENPGHFTPLSLDHIPARERLSAVCADTVGKSGGCVRFDCPLVESHLPDRPTTTLTVFANLADPALPVVITDRFDPGSPTTGVTTRDAKGTDVDPLTSLAHRLNVRPIPLRGPWPLSSVEIPKPWGKEIWFTGIEERGVSYVLDTPLNWLIHVAGDLFDTATSPPLLLKILAPLPESPKGDLYFELHEQKQEVYIVTGIDPVAWPDGVGEIRMGFAKQKRAAFEDHTRFLDAFRHAVADYEQVRRRIDSGDTAPHLESLEKDKRAATETFTASVPLKVGDVVQVPTRVPHSLRHGVRVVEFQTPHYERKIISFAQKVVTQDHWDTDEALSIAREDVPETDVALISDNHGVRCERVCRFDEFEVHRYTLAPGASLNLVSPRYQLALAITRGLESGGSPLVAEQAFVIPGTVPWMTTNSSPSPALLLVAGPVG